MRFIMDNKILISVIIIILSLMGSSDAHGMDNRCPQGGKPFERGNVEVILKSSHLTHWGKWGEWKFCHDGDLVKGITLEFEKFQQNEDDTGLNELYFTCSSPDGKSNYRITSQNGRFGDKPEAGAECNSSWPAIGIKIRSQAEFELEGIDNVGTTDVMLKCGGNGENNWLKVNSDNKLNRGYWTEGMIGPSGTAICGLQTQLVTEIEQGPGDWLSINNVNIACCKLSSPAIDCRNPSISWKEIILQKELDTFIPKLAYNEKKTGVVYPDPDIYTWFGLGIENRGMLIDHFLENRHLDVEISGYNLLSLVNDLKTLSVNGSIKLTLDKHCKDGKNIEVLEINCWFYTLQTAETRCKV